jgi:regulator of replication initiation timing
MSEELKEKTLEELVMELEKVRQEKAEVQMALAQVREEKRVLLLECKKFQDRLNWTNDIYDDMFSKFIDKLVK